MRARFAFECQKQTVRPCFKRNIHAHADADKERQAGHLGLHRHRLRARNADAASTQRRAVARVIAVDSVESKR